MVEKGNHEFDDTIISIKSRVEYETSSFVPFDAMAQRERFYHHQHCIRKVERIFLASKINSKNFFFNNLMSRFLLHLTLIKVIHASK